MAVTGAIMKKNATSSTSPAPMAASVSAQGQEMTMREVSSISTPIRMAINRASVIPMAFNNTERKSGDRRSPRARKAAEIMGEQVKLQACLCKWLPLRAVLNWEIIVQAGIDVLTI